MPYDYREAKELNNEELIARLTQRYEPTKIPPCRVCGGPLSMQAVGGGNPTEWACSGREYDPDTHEWIGWQKGRTAADDHYRKSGFTDRRQGGDEDVMELIERFKIEWPSK